MFIEVKDGAIVGELFNMTNQRTLINGSTVCGLENARKEDLVAIGIFEVIEQLPEFNTTYQTLINQKLTFDKDTVIMTFDTENNVASYPRLVENRLKAFAKEKDIDLTEIGALINSTNLEWVIEATTYSKLHAETWTAFYAATSTDWIEIESTLPVLSW